MGLFDIFKKLGGETEKAPPPKTPLELLEIELRENLGQFNRFHKDTEIGFGKAEFFKTEVWDNFKEEVPEAQKQAFEKAYQLIQKMNEELSLLEVEKNGYIKGNISRNSKDEGQTNLENALRVQEKI
jgi:ornithine carbamoyltransferase